MKEQKNTRITAPAKINLNLEITGKREDGYHLLKTVMQTLDFCDEIEIEKNTSGKITLECDTPGIPTDGKNLMCRAAALMKESLCIPDGFDMKLIKKIPSQAGLGGGSSDAAAVIKSINKLCSLNLSNEEMRKLAVKIGADVPFFIEGGTALCEGIGEKVTPVGRDFAIERSDAVYTLIVKPPEGADTKEIYRLYDEYSEKTAISKGDETVYANVLEPITASLVKTVARIRKLIENENAVFTAMSGSGTAVFGLFTDKDSMHNAAENIKNILPDAKIIQTELK